ncbi:MAG: protein-methionine-sulfoxide reductase catalytic subunit MsrP [Chromatiales bacterium]|jgi:sulfoxide reductase catalytic subunit YedY|nr:protein-methionine-sulfoxide reductase catalytic subunit MsrP [Chromatiales bacterium]
MLIRKAPDIRPSEITPERVFRDRRRLLKAAGFIGASALLAEARAADTIPANHRRLANVKKVPAPAGLTPNTFEEVTGYNNFYEFGTDKSDPAANSGKFRPKPWKVAIEGEAEVTGSFDFDALVSPHQLEERIYRFRCVEAWSMVIPWVGIPLGDVLKRFKPSSKAKYVAFETVMRPEEMPGQRYPILDWPYVEGLTIAEAMHPLTLLVTGVYGVELPAQNGAPLRLMVPWKYGFKSIKSIVRIRFTEQQPPTSWNLAAPDEYGFYANVNPKVDHPRWSQASERVVSSGLGSLLASRVPTQPFNGYAAQVASLYTGLDLARNF